MRNSGMTLFVTQGALFAGITLLGLIAASGRLIDAFLDPWIGSKSDSCKHPLGRRMPFMRYAAIPFGIITTLVFVSPVNHVSTGQPRDPLHPGPGLLLLHDLLLHAFQRLDP